MKKFGTVLQCMDGRPLESVARYLLMAFEVEHLDTVTTAGIVKHLAENSNETPTLLANTAVSVNAHGSRNIGVVAHHDCAGNPIDDQQQKGQVIEAARRLRDRFPDCRVLGLWVNDAWDVERIEY